MPPMADHDQPLRERDVDAHPIKQFDRWFADASAAGVRMPEAMSVSTASVDGIPSSRMVLMKGYDERGVVFFTNYASRKGSDLTENPQAALLFYWDVLGRQVRIDGPVTRTSPQESADYSRSRPRGSRISALASPQSRPVAARAELESLVAAAFASPRRAGSSGRTATTGSTTGCCTRLPPTAAGRSSVSRPERGPRAIARRMRRLRAPRLRGR
jgi:pyridoxamine-phosphate oxidase